MEETTLFISSQLAAANVCSDSFVHRWAKETNQIPASKHNRCFFWNAKQKQEFSDWMVKQREESARKKAGGAGKFENIQSMLTQQSRKLEAIERKIDALAQGKLV